MDFNIPDVETKDGFDIAEIKKLIALVGEDAIKKAILQTEQRYELQESGEIKYQKNTTCGFCRLDKKVAKQDEYYCSCNVCRKIGIWSGYSCITFLFVTHTLVYEYGLIHWADPKTMEKIRSRVTLFRGVLDWWGKEI